MKSRVFRSIAKPNFVITLFLLIVLYIYIYITYRKVADISTCAYRSTHSKMWGKNVFTLLAQVTTRTRECGLKTRRDRGSLLVGCFSQRYVK